MMGTIKLFRCIFVVVFLTLFVNCGKSEDNGGGIPKPSEAERVATKLWNTSALNFTIEREGVFNTIQGYADICPAKYFTTYLKSLDSACESMEKSDKILTVYRKAFDRVLDGVKNTTVAQGSVTVWMLYNMGYVVKTPSGCFGIDINHRWAKKLAPYLDFLCITHNHSDHYDIQLIEAMVAAGKPVISNYILGNSYTSTVAKIYTVGNFSIKTAITDHNNAALKNFVSVFKVDCGDDTNNFTLLHCGDSNYNPTQFGTMTGNVDLLIPRYAPNAMTENNIIGTTSDKVNPKYLFMSHILELAHAGVEESRWSLSLGLERTQKMNCSNSYMPFWGEKFTYINGQFN